jgi:hypothetical protein
LAETIGSLIDKLSIVNVKLFMIQDQVHGAARAGVALSAEATGKLVSLNRQRNRLMTEIEELLDASIRAGGAEIDSRPKL